MRCMDIFAACVVAVGSSSLLTPAPASATYLPPPVIEELWGYCCTAAGTRCCSRNGCEITQGRCRRLE